MCTGKKMNKQKKQQQEEKIWATWMLTQLWATQSPNSTFFLSDYSFPDLSNATFIFFSRAMLYDL